MISRSADLLSGSAFAAAAQLSLTLLDEARQGCGRLGDPGDAEALHDFRVALRRLRTVLRSFRETLGRTVPKRLQRRLRDVARATNAGRDAEVQLVWIRSHLAELGSRPGLPWLLARLEDRRDRAYAELQQETTQEFRQLELRLRRALNAARADGRASEPPFAAAVAMLIREHVAALEQELAASHAARDDEAIHRARIAAKRLRYLLEPLMDASQPAHAAVARLKQLQTLLGELHDLQVLVAELGELVGEAAAERARGLHAVALDATKAQGRAKQAGPRPATAGLLALAKLAGRSRDELFQRLQAEWKAGPLAALAEDLRALADSLTAAAIPPPVLPEPAAPLPKVDKPRIQKPRIQKRNVQKRKLQRPKAQKRSRRGVT